VQLGASAPNLKQRKGVRPERPSPRPRVEGIFHDLVIPPKSTSTSGEQARVEEPAVPSELAPQSGSRGIEAVLDPVPGAWFFVRPDGTFAYVSLGACAWLGYTRAEVRNLSIFDVDPVITREAWHELWNRTNPPDSLTVRTVHLKKDGTRSPVEVRAVRVYINGEDLAVSYSVDLTQSEQTRTALVNTQAELERLISHLPDLVFRVRASPNVELSFVSPSCSALLGYAPHELAGPAGVHRIIHPDDLSEFLSLQQHPDGTGRRVRFIHRLGHIVWMELRTTPLFAPGGDSAMIEGVARDVTQEREREQRAAQAQERQKLEALGQLAGGIAHDFNNLLQVISGNTQLARAPERQANLDALLAGVATAAERASALVKQLLAFSRRGSVEFSEVDLDQTLSSLVQMLERLMGEHIVVTCTRPGEKLCVRGNAAQLEQLIVNLCVNARDALPRGGRLTLALDEVGGDALPEAALRQLSAAAASYARLTVQDDGQGMSLEVQDRMYEPFFTTKGPGKGTGLGLSTVYAVVQSHSGALDVVSSPGKGSTFAVFFPRIAPAPERPSRPAWSGHVAGNGRLALAAEDEPDVLQLTANYLTWAGFRVITAKDGERAAALIEEHQHELSVAVLDVIMPKQSGVEIVQSLRRRGIRLPIVMVTGYDEEEIGQSVGNDRLSILRKPFGSNDLLGQIALVLGESANAQRPS
jgi:two-component system cell cycle sensor histidine kinase/response regulator CckA